MHQVAMHQVAEYRVLVDFCCLCNPEFDMIFGGKIYAGNLLWLTLISNQLLGCQLVKLLNLKMCSSR